LNVVEEYFPIFCRAFPFLKNYEVIVDIKDLGEFWNAEVKQQEGRITIILNKRYVKNNSQGRIILTLFHELSHILVGMADLKERRMSEYLDTLFTEFIVWQIAILKILRVIHLFPPKLREEIVREATEIFKGIEHPVHIIFDCAENHKCFAEQLAKNKKLVRELIDEQSPLSYAMTSLITLMYVVKTENNPKIDIMIYS